MNKRRQIIISLIILGVFFNITIMPEGVLVGTQSEGGRIVVIADDWPLSDRYWSLSASTFALNAFDWLTEFSSGKWILKDAYSDMPTKNNLIDTLQTNGYTVTIMDTTSWTPALLATYDAVLIEYCSVNNTLLTEYVTGGGGVFLIGGHFGSEQLFNEFLLHFGMRLKEPVDLGEPLTSFVPHPVTIGVSSLEIWDPTPIAVHTSDPLVLSTWGSWNMLVVCSKAEAPTVTVASPNGGESWQDMQTITWTATDPQGDPLTYTVYYSSNGGQTWTQLATGLTEPSYLWDTTTVEDGTNYRIKVEASDGTNTGWDTSNESFETANGPTVTVASPNGGESWQDMQTITWTATDPQGDPLTYTVYYSSNGGQTWTQLATGLTEPSYLWDTTTVEDGTNYRIKVEASDGTNTRWDTSNESFEIANEPIPTEPSEGGRIVVSADDWPLSDRYWSLSASTFALNAFDWLTEFSSGKRILKDAYSDMPTKNNLIDTLQTNGYTVTIMDTTSWTPALLATYDAVLIEYCSVNNTLLTEYVTGGGGVFLIGGHFGSEQLFNEFLLHFGMSLQEPVDLGPGTFTSFMPHPVTTGVSSLGIWDPTPIAVHTNDPLVLSTWGSWNLLVVYSKESPAEAPEAPIVTVVSPNGGEYWNGTQTITWIATDPQDDPLTYTVYYSPNGGQNWTQLATELTESSYLWDTTTVEDGANYRIKVEVSDSIHTEVDVSDAPFEIANELMNTAPTVWVLWPNGGERVHGMFEIQWRANDPEGDALTFTISYSPNGGDTWTQLTSGVTETSYQWDTSNVQVGENYLIKIEASDGRHAAEDRSDAPFTVEREVSTETYSEVLFVPSFRVIEALGALLVILGLGKRRRRRNM